MTPLEARVFERVFELHETRHHTNRLAGCAVFNSDEVVCHFDLGS